MYDYGCLMLSVDVEGFRNLKEDILIDDVVKWEIEPHITILYGIHEGEPNDKILSVITNREVVEYNVLGIDYFDTEDYDVLKFKVDSYQLERMNSELRELVKYTNEYPDYDAHITIAYLKKGTGKKYVRKFKEPITLKSKKFKLSMPPSEVVLYNTDGELLDKPQSVDEPFISEARQTASKTIDKINAYYLTDIDAHSETRKEFSKIKEGDFKVVDIKTLHYDTKKHVLRDAHGFNFDFKGNIREHVFFIRWGNGHNESGRHIVEMLEEIGYLVVNPISVREFLLDKYRTNEFLSNKGIEVPKQKFIDRTVYELHKNKLSNIYKEVGLPAILKITNGSKGVCVNKIDDETELRKVIEDYIHLDSNVSLILQEMVENDGDYRVHVVRANDQIKTLAVMLRKSGSKKDVRNNFSAGGDVEIVKNPDKEIIELSEKTTELLKGNWLGIDIIGKKGNYKVLEANVSSGLEGINSVLNYNLADEVLKFFKENLYLPTPLVAGYIETFTIEGVDYPAKLDSGNGIKASTIHGEVLKEEDGFMIWRDVKGKTHKNPIVGEASRERGDKVDHHKVISIDLRIGKRIIQGARFIIDKRDGKSTPVLINRRLLTRLNLIVDSNSIFLLSEHSEMKDWGDNYDN